jgi:hypothetical protein
MPMLSSDVYISWTQILTGYNSGSLCDSYTNNANNTNNDIDKCNVESYYAPRLLKT